MIRNPLFAIVLVLGCGALGACNADSTSSRHSVTPASSPPVAVPSGQHRLPLDQPVTVGPLTLTFKGVQRVYMAQGAPQVHRTALLVEVREGDAQTTVWFGEGERFNAPHEAFGVLLRMVGSLEQQADAATIEVLWAHSAADCSVICSGLGRCMATNGRCVVGSDADCAKAPACAETGACSAQAGTCIAASDDACEASRACTESGLCQASQGECVAASRDDCARSTNCKLHGLCTLANKRCDVGSSADCEASGACAARGECVFSGGQCRPEQAAHCRQSKLCEHGRCDFRAGSCVPGSQQDCDKDPVWHGLSLYDAKSGTCIPQCARSSVCTALGKCTPKEGRCSATSDADCRASSSCKSEGNCKAYLTADFCGAGTDADCKSSEECKTKGNCTLRAGEVHCRPGSDEDCRASEGCKTSGRCKAGALACE